MEYILNGVCYMKKLSDIKLFMLDMDGTLYLGDKLLPGAAEFIEMCRGSGRKFTFLTNNSSKSGNAYIEKLARLGIEAADDEMLTSGDATLIYMEQEAMPKDIVLIGTESLEEQFIQKGYNIQSGKPGAVVLGFDTGINYAKLTALCNAVRQGLPYIATHPDFNCPVPGGYIPDIGAVIAFVEAATGRLPDAVIGKPNDFIAKAAAKRANVALEDVCMVGDRLYTDIALGKAGLTTVLLLSGESSLADMRKSPFKPDYIFENLGDMTEKFE